MSVLKPSEKEKRKDYDKEQCLTIYLNTLSKKCEGNKLIINFFNFKDKSL